MNVETPNILLPIDRSPWATRGLDTARFMADALKATVHVLHVEEALEEASLDWYEALQRKYDGMGLVFHRRKGEVVEEILAEAATREGIGLIVMPTHGESGDLKKLMGHVTGAVVQQARVPVLLTRRNMELPLSLRRVLIPLDGQPQTAQIVPFVEKMAQRSGAEIHLLHVVGSRMEHKARAAAGSMAPPKYMDHPAHEWSTWEHEFIERFCDMRFCAMEKIPVRLSLGRGAVEHEILQYTREHQVNLIAMGWNGLLTGSRAHILKEVIQQAPCPVLVHHT